MCIVESEIHMVQALEDIQKNGCNALCVYLGNFGPEISNGHMRPEQRKSSAIAYLSGGSAGSLWESPPPPS